MDPKCSKKERPMSIALKLSIAVAIVLEVYRIWKQPQSRYVFDRRTGAIRPR